MQRPECLFVVVNYFSEEEVLKFFKEEILQQQHSNWMLCMVNNGSKNEACIQELSALGVHIVIPGENAGYLGAAGHALHFYQKEFAALPDLLVLSNSDMHYCQSHLLEQWQMRYAKANDLGMIGCRITSTLTGKPQNPMYRQRLSKAHLQRLAKVFSNKWSYVLYQTAALIKGKLMAGAGVSESATIEEVYAIHGSCMVMHRRLLAQPDLFKDAPFLFGEEVYLAEICRREHLKVLFDPACEILHQEHQTTGIYKSAIQRKRLADALLLILKKFHSAL